VEEIGAELGLHRHSTILAATPTLAPYNSVLFAVAFAVAGCAAVVEFVDDGVVGDFEVTVVVLFEHFCGSAVDASLVAFVDDSFLAGGGVALAAVSEERSRPK
jgi:hypothetical protein